MVGALPTTCSLDNFYFIISFSLFLKNHDVMGSKSALNPFNIFYHQTGIDQPTPNHQIPWSNCSFRDTTFPSILSSLYLYTSLSTTYCIKPFDSILSLGIFFCYSTGCVLSFWARLALLRQRSMGRKQTVMEDGLSIKMQITLNLGSAAYGTEFIC